MKKIYCLFYCLFLSFFLFAEPVLQVFPTGEINLGKLPQELKKTFPVIIKNVGNSDLVIDSIYASCGCTAAELANKTIAPGGEAEVTVTFDTGRFIGDVRKGLTIVSNDKTSPRLMIYFVANIYEVFISNPKYVDFEKVVRRVGKKMEIEFSRVDNQKIQIKNAEYNEKIFNITWTPMNTVGKENKIKIYLAVKPNIEIADFNERIKLNMDGTETPNTYTLFATGMMVDNDLYFEPIGVNFKSPDEINNIKLKSYNNNFYMITDIKNDIPYLIVKYKKISKSEYLFTVTLDKTKDVQKFVTEISVVTNFPQEETKKLSVSYQ